MIGLFLVFGQIFLVSCTNFMLRCCTEFDIIFIVNIISLVIHREINVGFIIIVIMIIKNSVLNLAILSFCCIIIHN